MTDTDASDNDVSASNSVGPQHRLIQEQKEKTNSNKKQKSRSNNSNSNKKQKTSSNSSNSNTNVNSKSSKRKKTAHKRKFGLSGKDMENNPIPQQDSAMRHSSDPDGKESKSELKFERKLEPWEHVATSINHSSFVFLLCERVRIRYLLFYLFIFYLF